VKISEGMVRIRDIKDDYYFDEKQYALVGATSHQLLQLEMKFTLKLKMQI
jgi:ribonuclease R